MDVEALAQRLRQFAAARDWEQFHSPKNLSMALAAEAGELLELFQWLTEEQSRELANDPEKIEKVREEVGDILIYLVRLCDQLDVDLEKAALGKDRNPEARRRSTRSFKDGAEPNTAALAGRSFPGHDP